MLDKVQCSVFDCTREVLSQGLCNAHYKRWRNSGYTYVNTAPIRIIKAQGAIRLCEVEMCNKLYFSSGMCTTHYGRETRRRNNEYKLRRKK